MKNSIRPLASRIQVGSVLAIAVVGITALSSQVRAVDGVKANVTDALNLTTSWVSGTAPDATGNAIFNNVVTGATSVALGGNLAWGGIVVADPGGAIAITGANALTLGANGINMSAAIQGLTISGGTVALGASQIWDVTANQVLSVGGVVGAANIITLNDVGSVTLTGTNTFTTGGGINVSNGVLTVASAAAAGNAASTIFLSGGTLNSGSTSFTSGQNYNITNTNTWISNAGQIQGTVTGNGTINWSLTGQMQWQTGGSGSTNFSGFTGVLNFGSSTGKAQLQGSNTGAPSNTFDIGLGSATVNMGTATFSMAPRNTSTQSIGALTGGVGTILNGSTVAAMIATWQIGGLNVSTTFDGSINNASTNATNFRKVGSATLTLTGTASTYTGTSEVQAGVLNVTSIRGLGASAATGALILGTATTTGTLVDNDPGASVSLRPLTFNGNGTIEVDQGSLSLTNTAAIAGTSSRLITLTGLSGVNTLGAAIVESSVAGNVTSLTKNGTNTWILTSATGHTYTGATAVNSGKLVIGGTLATSGISVASGARLDPVNGVGTLQAGNISLAGGSIVDYEFGTGTNDLINLNNTTLSLGTGVTLNLFNAGSTTAFGFNGTYTLFSNVGTLVGNPATNLVIGNSVGGAASYTFSQSGSNILLTIAGGLVVNLWNVNGSASWAPAGSWTDHAPNTAGELASFLGVLTSGTATVTLDGSKTVGTLLLNDTAGSYNISQGSGGSLILDNGTNSANINNQGGLHSVSAPITLNSNLVVTVASSTLTLSGPISDGGTLKNLTLTGTGLVLVTNTNTYGGTTTIPAGIAVQLGDGSATATFGTGTVTNAGSLTIGGGGTTTSLVNSGQVVVNSGGTANATTNSGTLTLNTGGTLSATNNSGSLVYNDGALGSAITNTGLITLNKTGPYNLDASISGVGTLTQAGASVTTVTANNSRTGPTNINAGSMTLGAGASIGTGALAIAAGSTFDMNSNSVGVTTLQGAGVVDNTGGSPVTLTLRVSGQTTWGGVIQNTGGQVGVKLTGTTGVAGGNITLNGVNTYSGKTILDNGTFSAGQIIVNVPNAISPSSEIDIVSVNGARALTLGTNGGANNVVLSSPVSLQFTVATSNTEFIGVSTNGSATYAGNVTLLSTFATSPQDVANSVLRFGSGATNSTLTLTGVISGLATGPADASSMTASVVNLSNGNIILDGASVNSFGAEFVLARTTTLTKITLQDNATLTSNVPSGEGGSIGGTTSNTGATIVNVGNARLDTNTGTFNINGGASATTLNLTGGGTLRTGGITKTATQASTLNLNGGIIIATQTNPTFLPAATALTVNVQTGGAVFNPNGNAITVAASLIGSAGDGGYTQTGTGSVTLTGANTWQGPTNVTGGNLTIGGNGVLPTNTALNLSAGTTVSLTSGMGAIALSSLSIPGTATAPTGVLDLKNAGLVLAYPDAATGSALAITTYKQVLAARGIKDTNGISDYSGQGITSSTASVANHAVSFEQFGLGVINNADLATVGINASYTTFLGQTGLTANVVLARYTYLGDINLDGKINIDDYNYIDDGFAHALDGKGLSGQILGDFNNDGVINIDDYNVIDSGFATQTTPLSDGGLTGLGGPAVGISAVPEPTSLLMLGLGAAGLLARRRRR